MSTLGFTSGRLDQEQTRLEELSRALLVVHAAQLGHGHDLKLSQEQVTEARSQLLQFVEQLADALLHPVPPSHEMAPVVQQILSSNAVPSDWSDDLAAVATALRGNNPLSETEIALLRKALGFIRQHVAESLSRTRPR